MSHVGDASESAPPAYTQTESAKPAWLWLLVLAIAAAAAGIIFASVRETPPSGSELWIGVPVACFACLLPLALLLIARIDYEIYEDAIRIRWVPFVSRLIPFSGVSRAEIVTYRPIREYGGWGIRGWGKKRAYSLSGDRGVLLTLTEGRTVLLGTAEPEPLAGAIQVRLPRSW